jgi:hypothetical protein
MMFCAVRSKSDNLGVAIDRRPKDADIARAYAHQVILKTNTGG